MDGRPFTRKDVITIQDPTSSELREIVKFEHIVKQETFQEQKQGELNVPEETKRILAKAGLSSSLSEGNKVLLCVSLLFCVATCNMPSRQTPAPCGMRIMPVFFVLCLMQFTLGKPLSCLIKPLHVVQACLTAHWTMVSQP
jgi:hypothetical protein